MDLKHSLRCFSHWVSKALLVLLLLLSYGPGRGQEAKVSTFGRYSGYSSPVYQQWVRSSQYISVRDGTKLAADIFRPASKNGAAVEDALPVVWSFERYYRARIRDGRLLTKLDEQPWLQKLLAHGYVIAVVEVRGAGASFGTWRAPFTSQEARDGYDVTEWFAAQPWCNGRVGMFGRSYMGVVQYLVASTAPPHLKAIFPEMAMFDLYSLAYPGGVFRNNYASKWGQIIRELDTKGASPPVEGDHDGAMLKKALKEHEGNVDVFQVSASMPYRDSKSEKPARLSYLESSPSSYLEGLKRSRVAVYHLAGWYDMYPRDALIWFVNLNNPQKIVIGPWSHNQGMGPEMLAEHLRWYDYWLKGIDNGVMKEPSLHYYTEGAQADRRWRSASQWPLPDEKPNLYYLRAEAGDGQSLAGQTALRQEPPSSGSCQSDYQVDYSTTSGTATRWTNGYGGPFGYPSMAANDLKGLSFTTSPLPSDLEVTGHPVVNLWVSSASTDADFFVYLEDVNENGISQYVTEGTLRASHGASAKPPFNYLGLPYHSSYKREIAPLTDQPAHLSFDLYPISRVFKAGHRIRLTITGADKDNALTPELSPPPTFSVYCADRYASHVVLPVIPAAIEGSPSPPGMAAVLPQSEAPPSNRLIIAVGVVLAALAMIFIMSISKKRRAKRFLKRTRVS